LVDFFLKMYSLKKLKKEDIKYFKLTCTKIMECCQKLNLNHVEHSKECVDNMVENLEQQIKNLTKYCPIIKKFMKYCKNDFEILLENLDTISYKRFTSSIRMLFEYITIQLLFHLNVPKNIIQEKGKLEGYLSKIKSIINSTHLYYPSLINSLFQLKNTIGGDIHITTSNLEKSISDTHIVTTIKDLSSALDSLLIFFENSHRITYRYANRYKTFKKKHGVSKNIVKCDSQGRIINAIGDKYKIFFCKNITDNGHCPLGDKCDFAHSDKDLRVAQCPLGYQCNSFKKGECNYYHGPIFFKK